MCFGVVTSEEKMFDNCRKSSGENCGSRMTDPFFQVTKSNVFVFSGQGNVQRHVRFATAVQPVQFSPVIAHEIFVGGNVFVKRCKSLFNFFRNGLKHASVL